MSYLSVKFNGTELNQYLVVTDEFAPFSGAGWDPVTADTGSGTNGSDFQYTAYQEKEIKMPFAILGDVEEKYHAFQKILNVSEPTLQWEYEQNASFTRIRKQMRCLNFWTG